MCALNGMPCASLYTAQLADSARRTSCSINTAALACVRRPAVRPLSQLRVAPFPSYLWAARGIPSQRRPLLDRPNGKQSAVSRNRRIIWTGPSPRNTPRDRRVAGVARAFRHPFPIPRQVTATTREPETCKVRGRRPRCAAALRTPAIARPLAGLGWTGRVSCWQAIRSSWTKDPRDAGEPSPVR